MAVQTFRFTDQPFEAVQWTGENAAEISEFTGQTVDPVSGQISIDTGVEHHVVEPGWWVRRGSNGRLIVTSGAARAADWVDAEPAH